jgi:hypothetical protein
VLAVIEDQSLAPGLPGNVRAPVRFLCRAIGDLITAGLAVHDDAGSTLAGEGGRALRRVAGKGTYATGPK